MPAKPTKQPKIVPMPWNKKLRRGSYDPAVFEGYLKSKGLRVYNFRYFPIDSFSEKGLVSEGMLKYAKDPRNIILYRMSVRVSEMSECIEKIKALESQKYTILKVKKSHRNNQTMYNNVIDILVAVK